MKLRRTRTGHVAHAFADDGLERTDKWGNAVAMCGWSDRPENWKHAPEDTRLCRKCDMQLRA